MVGDNKRRFYLWLFLALFVISRIFFLLYAHPQFFWDEELNRGALAKAIIDGKLIKPLFEYQMDHYSGGSLVVGLLAVPFFLLFGPSSFSLKLVGLTFFTATLLVWILFLRRYFNDKVAFFFAMLFIFSPLFFTEMSVKTMGFHSESTFFTAVVLFVFYEIFFRQKRRWFYFMLLGIVCGIGLWFTYIFGITLICCLLCLFFFDRKFLLKKDFWVISLGFLFGFSPWIYYNLTHQFRGLSIMEIPIQKFFVPSNLFEIFTLKGSVIVSIPFSLHLDNIWIFNRNTLAVFYFLVFIIAYVSMFWHNRKRLLESKELFFLLYCLILSLAFQLAINHSSGYLIPLYPFIFVTIAIFLSRLIEAKVRFKRVFSVSLISILVLISLASNINIIYPEFAGYSLKAPGYTDIEAASIVSKYKINSFTMPKFCALAKNLNAEDRNNYLLGLFEEYQFESKETKEEIDKLFEIIKQVTEYIEPKYHKQFYELVGNLISTITNDNDIEIAKLLVSRLEPAYQHYIYGAWADNLGFRPGMTYEDKEKIIERIGEDSYPNFYRGLGFSSGGGLMDVGDKIDEKFLPDFYIGVGKAMAYGFLDPYNRTNINW
jgi:4-amino-4-deoxy-L-arabinose transferase-like glycosyltransferase